VVPNDRASLNQNFKAERYCDEKECKMKNQVKLFSLVSCLLVSHALGASTTHYVDISSQNPVIPYTNWSTAATNIQDAVDAATDDDLVLVTNGVYANGGRVVYGSQTNRVAVTKRIVLESVNGPRQTVIAGYQVPGSTNGNSAVRCVYLTSNAVLAGFTLTNGATRIYSYPSVQDWREVSGGGVYCDSTTAVVTNCIIAGNSASFGGGAESGTINNSSLIRNSVANQGNGGGAHSSMLNNCLLLQNTAIGGSGGGAWAFAGSY
jgi:hypothetical protein